MPPADAAITTTSRFGITPPPPGDGGVSGQRGGQDEGRDTDRQEPLDPPPFPLGLQPPGAFRVAALLRGLDGDVVPVGSPGAYRDPGEEGRQGQDRRRGQGDAD